MTTTLLRAESTAGSAAPSRSAAPGRRLRVLQITQDLGIGGLERVIATIVRSLDPSAFEAEVLCLRYRGEIGDELVADGVPVHCLDWDSARPDYFAFRRVARVLRERRIDVVHSHNTNALVDGALGAWLAGVRTIVHTDHARDFPDALRYRVAEHVLSHRVHRMVAVSEHGRDNLRRYEWIPRRKLTVIRNGVDGARLRRPVDTERVRRMLALPDGDPVIGLGARLMEQKGIIYLLRAMPRLLAKIPRLRLVIAGDGDLEQPLRRAALELGIAERTHFIGARTDLPDVMRLFDIFVLPSIWEGLPLSVLEALAAGIPIVASRVGGVPGALRNGELGVLVEPRDPDALAEAIASLLADAPRRARFAELGRAAFDAEFSAEAMTRRYELLYRGADA